MKKYIPLLILINLILVLIYINHSILTKEKIVKDGRLVLLELAPVDPRSLMQGDYMDLRYRISDGIYTDSIARRGYCIVQLDKKHVAHRVRFQDKLTPLYQDEYPIAYTSPDKWRITIGAESFFFQEGQAKKYEAAKYGALRIDARGNSLLVGLYDENLQEIN